MKGNWIIVFAAASVFFSFVGFCTMNVSFLALGFLLGVIMMFTMQE